MSVTRNSKVSCEPDHSPRTPRGSRQQEVIDLVSDSEDELSPVNRKFAGGRPQTIASHSPLSDSGNGRYQNAAIDPYRASPSGHFGKPGIITVPRSAPEGSYADFQQPPPSSKVEPSPQRRRPATSNVRSRMVDHDTTMSGTGHDSEANEDSSGRSSSECIEKSPVLPSEPSNGQGEASQISAASIRSSSPLVTRLREQRSRGSLVTRLREQQLLKQPKQTSGAGQMHQDTTGSKSHGSHATVDELEEALHNFDRCMRDDHAMTVRWLLHDAKNGSIDAPKTFIDPVSPFGKLGGVQWKDGDAAPRKALVEQIDSYVFRKTNYKSKIGKISTRLVAKVIEDGLPKVPKYSANTFSKRNHLTADDEQLRFIPYVEEDVTNPSKKISSHQRLMKELEEAYKNDRSLPCREAECATRIRGYLDSWLEELQLGCDEYSLQRYLLQHESHILNLGKKTKVINMLLTSLGGPLAPTSASKVKAFVTAFQHVFDQNVIDVVLPETHVREMISLLKSERAYVHRLSTFTDLTCLICGVICCQTHGSYSHERIFYGDDTEVTTNGERSLEWEYIHQPLVMKYEETHQDPHRRSTSGSSEAERPENQARQHLRCSKSCYKHKRPIEQYQPWSEGQRDALKQILLTLSEGPQQACTISYGMDWSCWEVFTEIQKFKNSESEAVETPAPMKSTRSSDRPIWYNNIKKTLNNSWQDHTTAHLHQERQQTNACGHQGPCLRDCPCYESNLLCESICGCPKSCGRRFTGCGCLSTGVSCTSETCICIQLNRECGPQCGTCGALERIDPANRYDDELFITGCQNIVLQRGVSKKTIVGESQLEGVGFGLYLAEPVQKGDFIDEYQGEVISYQEADRRGIMYDRQYLSFLFDLNSEWVIDAARYGNKTRFINHADNDGDGLNCEAKIVLVNGEHRIKFVALRDLRVGEELLFNYGKKFAEKHGLSKKLPKVNDAEKKKGVLVGKEALDALDGMDPENRASRKKLKDIRAEHERGQSGSKRGKARKTAAQKPRALPILAEMPLVEEEQQVTSQDTDFIPPIPPDDDNDEDYDDEEDDEEENAHTQRRRRKITRPKRYTR